MCKFNNKTVLGFAGGSIRHKDLFRNYGMQEKRIFLMPMLVDNSKFLQYKKKFPELFTFLYVGRIVEHKNVEALIKQFNKNFNNKPALLKIVGSGEQEFYLRERYASEKVIFLGSLFSDDLIFEFHNASCFVLPSTFEPWGLVVNEALASALPVISLEGVGANYDLIEARGTGVVASDMLDFSDNMLKLYHDLDLLTQFSDHASDLMRRSWNYDLYDQSLHCVIKKIQEWD